MSTPCISILGCGWLGLPLGETLVHLGYTVNGSTTRSERLPTIASKGIQPFVIDISNLNADVAAFLTTDILIIAITHKTEAHFRTLANAIAESPVKHVIFISSTSVYPNTNAIVTEEDTTSDTLLASIEQLFINRTEFTTTIIRFAGLFGASRHPGRFMKPDRPANNPEGFINLIHLDDCIGIICKLIETNSFNTIFNACADTHPTRRAFYTKAVLNLGKPAPKFNETSTNDYKIISNTKVKSVLNYTFKVPDLMAYLD